ncbi:hypothetical protein PGTUg99_018335 [Puccinia graminis f. sp. tritici]|uniref:Uncharacterized protein n=2 Tax=Puccinia graminis f. sp. tritici TaxID=56615 RepID=A0A5B0NHZ3_PUCGR|nr:hypothetical protein PGTUg99_018335 [Puccinia graminis f. sp. tritici]
MSSQSSSLISDNHRPPASSLPGETLAFAERIFDGARAGDLPLLTSAIEAGLPVELTNASGELSSYCYSDMNVQFIHHNTFRLDEFPDEGNNLLMLAAYHGRAELVRFLLSRGAQPDRLNERGQSALSGAVFKGWTEVVKALVEAGADIRAGKPNAIDCAYMFKRDDYWQLLGASASEISSDVPQRIP